MNMKKMLFGAVVALSSLLTFADGQYLYWMVDVGKENTDFYFNYATVSANGNVLLNYASVGDEGSEGIFNTNVVGEDYTVKGYQTESVYAYDVSPYLQSTFLFELFDADNELVLSRSISAASLTDYIGAGMSQTSPFVIPEPTSGLLVLIGLAGLALRRRRSA